MNLERKNRYKSFGGWVEFYEHSSNTCNTPMRFSIYLPPQAESEKVPVLYWLSGLTCTEENFMVKAGAQRYCSELGIALVAPDTSPRGAGVEGEDTEWDLGTGAGFYVNATTAPWSGHYRMYDYVTRELPGLITQSFSVDSSRKSIMGHSMGGHGALVIALREVGQYRSVSAFSPICAPSRCPWGRKAFTHYLGDDTSVWAEYDASELVRKSSKDQRLELWVDQGTEDKFLVEQLMPEVLETSCKAVGYPIHLRRQIGYDHSYYFIATFVEDHIRHHAKALGAF